MKNTSKLFKTAALLAITLMFGFNGNAQNDPKTNKLAVQVGEFYSLNLSSDNATIKLDSEAKFAEGSESSPITMTIFSSRKYAVTAKVSSEQFNGTAENTTVNTNNIDLIVTKNGNSDATISQRANNSLKHSSAEEIASSTKATKADVFNLVYAIPAQNTAAFLDQYGKTISTEITYTLLPL